MTLPKKLKIGGHIYKVIVFKDETQESSLGLCDYHKHIIYINGNMPESMQMSTLIHEAMHVMNSTLQHELLDSLSEQMYQFLSANNLLKK